MSSLRGGAGDAGEPEPRQHDQPWTDDVQQLLTLQPGRRGRWKSPDRLHTREYRWSLAGSVVKEDLGWAEGFEPSATGTTIRRSTKLSYAHRKDRNFSLSLPASGPASPRSVRRQQSERGAGVPLRRKTVRCESVRYTAARHARRHRSVHRLAARQHHHHHQLVAAHVVEGAEPAHVRRAAVVRAGARLAETGSVGS